MVIGICRSHRATQFGVHETFSVSSNSNYEIQNFTEKPAVTVNSFTVHDLQIRRN